MSEEKIWLINMYSPYHDEEVHLYQATEEEYQAVIGQGYMKLDDLRAMVEVVFKVWSDYRYGPHSTHNA